MSNLPASSDVASAGSPDEAEIRRQPSEHLRALVRIKCPDCQGERFIESVFMPGEQEACPRCNAVGSILVDPEAK